MHLWPYLRARSFTASDFLLLILWENAIPKKLKLPQQLYANIKILWLQRHRIDLKHSSNVVTKLLNDNKVKVLEWSSQSPDLDPIENLYIEGPKTWGTMSKNSSKVLWEARGGLHQVIQFQAVKSQCLQTQKNVNIWPTDNLIK